jgi:hypothetical protein
MLHVARESRQVLLDSGYELAFRTRTHGPRTWFNFKKDILYIGRVASFEENWDFHNLLSGNPMWDIGQYQPVDMKRVRRIALGEAGDHVSDNFDESVVEVSNILQLFPSVEELFLEEHGLQPLTKNFPKREGLNDDESWWHTSVVELDALSYLINDCVVCFAGYHNHHLKAYKENNMGDGSRYFVDAVSKFEEGLVRTRDRVVPSGAIAPWKIPEVRIVHIGYPWALRQLSDRRWATWNHVQNLRELEGRSKAIEEAHRSISVPNKLILDRDEEDNLPPSPFTVKYQDDLEAYDEYYMIPYHYDEEYETPRRRSSWVLQGTLAAPDQSP